MPPPLYSWRIAAPFAAAGCALIGCASVHGPSKSQLAAANYGAPIAQAPAESQARAFLQSRADLSRSTLVFDPIERGYARADYPQGEFEFGYRLYATLNEKDDAGYFTGPANYIFVFRDGSICAAYHVAGIKADMWDYKPRLMRIR